jgi:hypothetical protein
VYDTLEDLNVEDWVNNDGGGGTFTIYVVADTDGEGNVIEAGHIEIDHHYNHTESTEVSYTA